MDEVLAEMPLETLVLMSVKICLEGLEDVANALCGCLQKFLVFLSTPHHFQSFYSLLGSQNVFEIFLKNSHLFLAEASFERIVLISDHLH